MSFLLLMLGTTAAILLLPTLSDLLNLLRRGQPDRPGTPAAPGDLPRLLFLVPAHDEEILIGACVRSLAGLVYPNDRYGILVVADNCSDRTAEIARAMGAECLERSDPTLPGKPRAIAWALDRLKLRDYDALVIIDADTVVAPNLATALAGAGPLTEKAVQAYYGVLNVNDSALTRMAAVLAAANHRYAYPFKRRVGLNTPLVGNGMCLGTRVLETHGWNAFSIAEDWELYAQFTALGVRIDGAPDAIIFAQEVRTLRDSSSQRQRWTAGKLTVLARWGAMLIRSRWIGFHQKLDAIAELTAPGPVLLLGIVTTMFAVALLAGFPTAVAAILLLPLARPALYTALALSVQPDLRGTARAFAFLPIYALWRVVAAAAALRMVGDKPWVRTQRH
jgi:1,2-diacylglycerol 3-beta-glucosyltransferase